MGLPTCRPISMKKATGMHVPKLPNALVSNAAVSNEAMPIPSNMAKYIVGKNGKTITRIIRESGAHVKCGERTASEWQVLQIKGTAPEILSAKKMVIQQLLAHQDSPQRATEAPKYQRTENRTLGPCVLRMPVNRPHD